MNLADMARMTELLNRGGTTQETVDSIASAFPEMDVSYDDGHIRIRPRSEE